MRYYTEISKEDFLIEVQTLMENEEFPYDIPSIIEKDLSKVNFDWENYTMFEDDNDFGYPIGYHELSPNFHIYLNSAGGDWEQPICYIFYWGDNELRAYIPKDGNVWNKKEKCAYGSEDDPYDGDYEELYKKEFSKEKLFKDILKRIVKK